MDAARNLAYWKDSLLLIVADHDARAWGDELVLMTRDNDTEVHDDKIMRN